MRTSRAPPPQKGMYKSGGWLGPPLLPGSPYGPRQRRAETFEASILLAPKAPKQNFGCQPQTLEGEGGGGGLPLLLRCTAGLTHHCPPPRSQCPPPFFIVTALGKGCGRAVPLPPRDGHGAALPTGRHTQCDHCPTTRHADEGGALPDAAARAPGALAVRWRRGCARRCLRRVGEGLPETWAAARAGPFGLRSNALRPSVMELRSTADRGAVPEAVPLPPTAQSICSELLLSIGGTKEIPLELSCRPQ